MAIPKPYGSNNADICLVHLARIVFVDTKSEIRFETKVACLYLWKKFAPNLFQWSWRNGIFERDK